MNWLKQQYWKGNVRELENVLLREFLLCNEDMLVIRDTHRKSHSKKTHLNPENSCSTLEHFQCAKEAAISEFERSYLDNILEITKGNIFEAARIAGKERRAFGKLVKKYNIDKARYKKNELVADI